MANLPEYRPPTGFPKLCKFCRTNVCTEVSPVYICNCIQASEEKSILLVQQEQNISGRLEGIAPRNLTDFGDHFLAALNIDLKTHKQHNAGLKSWWCVPLRCGKCCCALTPVC